MKYQVFYHVDVESDIFDAKEWYKSKEFGLEKRFTAEIKKSINILSSEPFIFQIKYKNVRTVYTKIFPFGIHYSINESTKVITILGVFHTSISPEKWFKRV